MRTPLPAAPTPPTERGPHASRQDRRAGQPSSQLRWAARLLVTLAVAALLAACSGAGRYIVLGSPKVPSTSGVVEVEALDGGSSLVSVHLEHLPPPSRLSEPFEAYVVWFEGDKDQAIRAGVLRYDPDSRTGDLSETSPLTDFTIKVTAEADQGATRPGAFVVASQAVRTP